MDASDLLFFERELWDQGMDLIAGIDEVGRGALAGPMVVCAAILDKNRIPDFDNPPEELVPYTMVRDSKLVTPKRRSILSEFLINEVISYSIVEVSHIVLDENGLVSSTQVAFSNAVKNLDVRPHHIFTDNYEIPDIAQHSQTNLKRGDNKSMTIAAASIIAKVYRDNLMVKLHEADEKYQLYCFDKHKGYGTLHHRNMIKKYGHSDIHRKSFKLK
jgi:ribonuclease HII